MKNDDMRLPLYLLILKWHSSNIYFRARILNKVFLCLFSQEEQLLSPGNGSDSVNISSTQYRPFTASTEQVRYLA
jgi:hypothetical protein